MREHFCVSFKFFLRISYNILWLDSLLYQDFPRSHTLTYPTLLFLSLENIKQGENKTVKTHTHTHLWTQVLTRQDYVMEKRSLLKQWCWPNLKSVYRRMKICKYLLPCTKCKSKWISDININKDRLNLREENVRNMLECIGTADNFLSRTPVVQAVNQQLINGTLWN